MIIYFIENENVNRCSSGGIMTYLLNLSNYLKHRKVNTTLVACGMMPYNNINTNFSNFISISKRTSISNWRFFFKLLFTKKINGINKHDIIHVQRPEMILPIALRKNNKIVCTLHGGQDLAIKLKKGKILGCIYSIIQTISFLFVDYLITVDNNNKERYTKKYPWIKKKIRTIPISINLEIFYPRNRNELRLKYNFNKNEKIIIYVGRLEQEKNLEFLINSFGKVEDKNLHLIIIGSGSLLDNLITLAKQCRNKVDFWGEIEHNEIPEIINCANALVLTSIYEGSPTVVKEAICCNVPVISTDIGDVKEIVNFTKAGIIIKNEYSSFVFAVKKILEYENYDFSDYRESFSHKKMGSKTLEVYTKLSNA